MNRMKKTAARAILDRHVKHVGLTVISAFQVERTARPDAGDLSWWHQNTPANETSDTVRNRAYLSAYLEIAGREQLTARGLQLDGGRLYMDRSVISRLERDGFLAFVQAREGFFEPFFELTEKGREWLAV